MSNATRRNPRDDGGQESQRAGGCVDETLPAAGELADRLRGQPLPVLPLTSQAGSRIVLQARLHAQVVYFFPGCPRSPEDGYDSPRCDVIQHRAFAACATELAALGCRAVGISSQGVELLREANVKHLLLSDPELQLARLLELPTFRADGIDWYRRQVLLLVEGHIAHAFRPSSARASATDAIGWLCAHRQETCEV